jgi:hypothetical protein
MFRSQRPDVRKLEAVGNLLLPWDNANQVGRFVMTQVLAGRSVRILCGVIVVGLCCTVALPRAHAQAENYSLFRLDMAVTGTYTHGAKSWGFGGLVEPKFNVLDFLAVGLRMEGSVMFWGDVRAGDSDVSMDIRGVAAFLAKCDYYVLDAPIRPFVGLGLGMYYLGAQGINTSQTSATIHQKAGAYFGLAPQVGIELGGFRLSVTYNAIFGAAIEVEQVVGTQTERSDYLQNYLSLEIGWRIGGGYNDSSDAGEGSGGE